MKYFKKLLIFLALISSPALADTWTDPDLGIVWTYTVSNSVIVLGAGSYNGNRAVSDSTQGAIEIPATMNGRSVAHIGNYAFCGCSDLTSVKIPLSITSIGNDAFYGCQGLTAIEIPSSVKKVGDRAFYNCTGLTSVTIPSSLEIIGDETFCYCSGLRSVKIPMGVTSIGDRAFYNCNGITSVTIPSTVTNVSWTAFSGCNYIDTVSVPGSRCNLPFGAVTNLAISEGTVSIKASAFQGQSSLKSVWIPSSVMDIGDSAFADCSGLLLVTVSPGVESVGGAAFYNCSNITSMALPSSVTNIGNMAFSHCGSIESLTIPEGVLSIGNESFYACSKLAKVNIPASLTNIGRSAFSKCSGLKMIIFSEGVTNIGEWMFSDCSGLSSLSFPLSLVSIGGCAFSGCNGLSSVEIPESVKSIGENAFQLCAGLTAVEIPFGTTVNKRAFIGCKNIGSAVVPGWKCEIDFASVTNLVISEGTENISQDAFSGCSALQSVVIPSSVTNLEEGAFLGCSALKVVNIPESVKSIGSTTFYNCTALKTVVLPEGLANIEDNMFNGCSELTNIEIPRSVKSIGAYAFTGCSALTSLTIPCGVMRIESGAFRQCSGLTSIAIPSSVTTIGDWAFSNCGSIGSVTVPGWKCGIDFSSVTNLTISEGTKEIRSYAFNACSAIKSVMIPSSVTNVGDGAFSGCHAITDAIVPGWKCGIDFSSVTNLTISDGTTSIANSGFSCCQNLLSVSIPEGVRSIGDSAFEDCDKLFSINLPDSLNCIGRMAFTGCDRLTHIRLPNDDEQIGSHIGYPEWKFRCWGDTEWSIDDASNSVKSGDPGIAEPYGYKATTLSSILCGAGDGSFRWKVDCEPQAEDIDEYYDYAVFSVDEIEIAKIAGKIDWQNVEWSIPDCGIHMLKWTFVRDDYDEDESLYENSMWIDDLSLNQERVTVSFNSNGATAGESPKSIAGVPGQHIELPSAGNLKNGTMMFLGWSDGSRSYAVGTEYIIPLCDTMLIAEWTEYWTVDRVLNAVNMTFSTETGTDWVRDFDQTHDGMVSLRSGDIEDSESTWVQAEFSGQGTLSFWTKCDGEFYRGKMCDLLTVTLDAVEIFTVATNDWTNVIVSVTSDGHHTIKWTYSKNAARSSDNDCAWLDEVQWMPTIVSEPIPDIGENPTAQQIAEALNGSTDDKLANNITDGTTYGQYRDWASKVKVKGGAIPAGTEAVKCAPNAWLSFALGSETLIEAAPTDGDLKVDNFEPATESGKFDFTVSVKDIQVGSDAAADNLKKVFGVEGGTTLDPGGLSSENVNITFGTPENGKVKFTAGPKNANEGSFFMRVKMTP